MMGSRPLGMAGGPIRPDGNAIVFNEMGMPVGNLASFGVRGGMGGGMGGAMGNGMGAMSMPGNAGMMGLRPGGSFIPVFCRILCLQPIAKPGRICLGRCRPQDCLVLSGHLCASCDALCGTRSRDLRFGLVIAGMIMGMGGMAMGGMGMGQMGMGMGGMGMMNGGMGMMGGGMGAMNGGMSMGMGSMPMPAMGMQPMGMQQVCSSPLLPPSHAWLQQGASFQRNKFMISVTLLENFAC